MAKYFSISRYSWRWLLVLGLAVACACTGMVAVRPKASSCDCQVAFSPHEESLQLVLQGIENAKKSIRVAAYAFTSKPIAMALLDAHKRGVDVRVLADSKANQRAYSAVTFLANQGVPVRTNDHYAIFHHKFMVIDGEDVETGSFNYSAAAASRNAENVLFLRNVRELAAQYGAEWQHLWEEGTPVEARY